MIAIRRDLRNPDTVSGSAVVEEALLLKKLGGKAYNIWRFLIEHRNPETGISHVTRATLGSDRVQVGGIKDRDVESKMKRLCKAGLVSNIGWRALKVPCKKRGDSGVVVFDTKLVYCRVVTGARAQGSTTSQCLVSYRTKAWLSGAAGWGGKRAGAGRKKQPKTPPKVADNAAESFGPGNLVLNQEGASGGVSGESSTVIYPDPVRNPDPEILRKMAGEKPPAILSNFLPELDQLTTSGSGPPRKPLPLEEPAYPGSAVVKTAIIPHPRALSAETSDADAVQLCLKLFRAAAFIRFGVRSYLYARTRDITTVKDWKKFKACVTKMREHDIAPATWIMWSFDAWCSFGGHEKTPPITWVFSANRVDLRHGWFNSEEHSYQAHTIQHGPIAKDLLRRWSRMRQTLCMVALAESRNHDLGFNSDDVIRLYFPGTTYADMVRATRREALDITTDIANRIKAGEWVWGGW